MGFSKGRRQHRRQPSWLKLATTSNSPYMGGSSEQSPWSSTQYTFSAAEASAFEEMASPTTIDEIGYAKKNDLRIEEAPMNTARADPTFATSGLDKYYRPVEGYEGLHRYDPDFEWEPEEERRIVRKVCFLIGISQPPETTHLACCLGILRCRARCTREHCGLMVQ